MRKWVLILLVLLLVFSVGAYAKTKLVWVVHWSDFQVEGIKDEAGNVVTKGFRQYIDEYVALNPDVEVEIQMVPFDDYLKLILVSHTAGKVSDIYGLYSLWGVQLADSGILDQPPADIVKTVTREFVKVAVEGSTINGQIYGVPMEVANYALIYNKEMLAEAGYKNPPKTWDELVDMAQKLTIRNADGTIARYGFAFLSGWDSAVVHPYLSLLYSLGGKFLTDDFSECLLDQPEALEALKQEMRLFETGGTDQAASVWSFPTGKVAMMINASWYESNMKIGFKDKYEAVTGVAPIPPLKDNANCGYTWFIGVDRGSKNKTEAWKLIKWMTIDKMANGTTRMGELMAMNIGSIPTNNADLKSFPEYLGDIFTSEFIKELKNTIQEPNVAQAQEIKTILMREIVEAWHGRKTPEAALRDAKKQIDEILAEFY
jgi:multiple sugar transport system substrate-binding protein